MPIILDPLVGGPSIVTPQGGPVTDHQAGDLGNVSRGIEATIEYNGLTFHDRLFKDVYRLKEIDGIWDADLRDQREENPSNDGELAYDALYGGRTVTLDGQIEAGNILQMRTMQGALRAALVELTEKPLRINWCNFSDDFTDVTSLLHYFFDYGAGEMTVGANGLTLLTGINVKKMFYTNRIYTNVSFAVRVKTPSAFTGGTFDVLARRVSPDNELRFRLITSNDRGQIRITTVLGGVGSNICLRDPPVGTLNASTYYWLYGWVQENKASFAIYTDTANGEPPNEFATPIVTEIQNFETSTGSPVLIPDGIIGTGAYGHAGMAFINTSDFAVDKFILTGITPTDIYVNARKNAPISMKERQDDLRPYRPFLVSLRASDPKWYSPFIDKRKLNVTATASGRKYPRGYNRVYETVSSGVFQNTTITNRGNRNSSPYFRVYGPLTDPKISLISGEHAGQYIRLIGNIGSGEYVDINSKTKTIVNSLGNNAHGMLDPLSTFFELQPGDNSMKVEAGTVGGSSQRLYIYNQSCWI